MTMTMSYEIYWILDIVDKQYLKNCECSSLRRHVIVIVLGLGAEVEFVHVGSAGGARRHVGRVCDV